uniref:Uncharacterized protein n=1 Tax=viral metagenome TaxID=1070528 RepID=A0A6M3JJS5_9ZZZZ
MIALLLSALLSAAPPLPADTPTPPVVVEMLGVLVQAPGVSVRVVGPSYYVPRTVMVPRTVLVPQTTLVPAQPVVTRRLYWTPIRDFFFGRHRIHYVPIQ